MTQLINHGILDGGGLVTPSATADMNTHIAAAGSLFQNQSVSVATTSVSHSASDSVLDRWDAVVSDSAGIGQIIQGTLGSPALQPDTQGYQDHAMVFVSAGTTAIDSTMIQDNRKHTLVQVSPYRVSGLWYGPQGNGSKSTGLWVNNTMWLFPFFSGKTFAAQALGMDVQIAGTAGSKARLGVYADDGNGDLSLLVDAGQVALDAVASPTASINLTLQPGWSWLALAFQSLGATKPSVSTVTLVGGGTPVGAKVLGGPGTANASGYGFIYYTNISGALPTIPTGGLFAGDPGVSPPAIFPGVWIQAA